MLRTLLILWVMILLLCSALPVSSSHPSVQSSGQEQPQLQYEVRVILKLIQVYVTDKSGKPVTDLTIGDFTVLDDGKPVKVTAFEKHVLPAAPPNAGEPPATETLVPTPIETRALGRKFILFFDFAFNIQQGVSASVQAALHFLDTQVLPGDEIALMSYSMLRGLRIHEYLTSDHAKVRDAVNAITVKEVAGRADDVELRYQQLAEIAQTQEGTQARNSLARELNKAEGQRREAMIQVQNYFQTMTALAKALRLVQGQKSILLFSTGVPYSMIYSGRVSNPGVPGRGGQLSGSSPRGSQFEIPESTLSPLQEGMLKEFASANCAFYAFDTRESSKLPSLFAYDELQFETRLGGMFGADGVHQSTTGLFRDDKTTGQDSLRRLSKETGGQYYSNITFYEKNLDQVQDITGVFYVLGYSISPAWDGKFHDLKVSVKRSGCQVRAQTGYYNPRPFRDVSDLEKELQLFDLALNERSDFQAPKRLAMAALSYDAGEGTRLRTISKIPREVLDAFGGKSAEFVALVFDDQENLISLQRAAVKPADYRGRDLLFSSGIAPQPGRYECRFVIRDLETGQSAVASSAVQIARRGPSKIHLGTPLLLVAGGGLGYIEGVTRGKSDFLSWRDLYPYDEARFSPLLGEVPSGSGTVGVVVPLTTTLPDETGLTFSASLVNAGTGAPAEVPFQLTNRTRQLNAVISFLEFPLDKIPEGKYLLYIHAGDRGTGAMANTHGSLVVVR